MDCPDGGSGGIHSRPAGATLIALYMQRQKEFACQHPGKITSMNRWFLFFAAIYLLSVSGCSKNTTAGHLDKTLVGKWLLVKSCVCGYCKDSNSVNNNQTIVFTSGGEVQLSGSVGDKEQYYSGTYTLSPQSGNTILNITMDAPVPHDFLYIPGSVIYSQTIITLVLNLNTPFGNPCLYQNTYVSVPH